MTLPSVGSKLGNYRLERVLGEGRMGVVFLARDEALLRRTAVKVLAWKFPADDALATPDAHLLAEAQLAARIDHPNVVRVYSVARHGEHCFIGLEYVDGASAAATLRHRGLFSFARTTEILLQVASGLQAVHEAGVVHRDLKPENLLIAADGTTKIADFGMALPLVRGRASDTNRAGTPLYTAPELWRGAVASTATDIYALGATYYTLLTGHPPFDAADLPGLISAHLNQPIPDVRLRRPDVPESCHALIQACLAKLASDRFSTAQEVAWAARGLLRQSASGMRSRLTADSDSPPVEPAEDLPGFDASLFGPLDPDDPALEREPFDELVAELETLGDPSGPAVALLVGADGSGRTSLARRLAANRRPECVTVYLGPADAPERSPIQMLARALGVVPASHDARATVDRIVHHLFESSSSRPALVILDRELPEPVLPEVALLCRGAKTSGSFGLLVIGSPELPAALAALEPTDRVRALAVPALTAAQTLRYILKRVRQARTRAPDFVVTSDAGLLAHHHSAGNLARIDALMKATVTRVARDGRVVLSTRDVALATEPGAALTAPWPSPSVLEILNARRRDVGLPPRQGPTDGHRNVELVAQIPGVTGVVLSHISGAVLDARGEHDAELESLRTARVVDVLARTGVQLGLGDLRSCAVVGPRETHLLQRAPGLVIHSALQPTAPQPQIEDQLARIQWD